MFESLEAVDYYHDLSNRLIHIKKVSIGSILRSISSKNPPDLTIPLNLSTTSTQQLQGRNTCIAPLIRLTRKKCGVMAPAQQSFKLRPNSHIKLNTRMIHLQFTLQYCLSYRTKYFHCFGRPSDAVYSMTHHQHDLATVTDYDVTYRCYCHSA